MMKYLGLKYFLGYFECVIGKGFDCIHFDFVAAVDFVDCQAEADRCNDYLWDFAGSLAAGGLES